MSVGSGINPPKEIGSFNVQRSGILNPTRWKNLYELLGSVGTVSEARKHINIISIAFFVQELNKRVHSNCECRCREQGIDYFRFNPKLDNDVDSGQIKTKKLLPMLWETKRYLHKEKEKMDKLIELLKQSLFHSH